MTGELRGVPELKGTWVDVCKRLVIYILEWGNGDFDSNCPPVAVNE